MPTELVNWATVIAAAAAVYSILLSVRALRDAGESRKFAEADHARQERAQAALVLSSADILRRRTARHWIPALADDLQPSAREAIRWRDEASHDVHLAEELVRRSSGVNLEVACFAELVYRKAGVTVRSRQARSRMPEEPRSRISSLGLAARSLLWAVLLPGLFAGYVPWRYFGLRSVVLDLHQPLHWVGLLGIGIGTALLAVCIVEFARSGRGTLSPMDPPRSLVVRGPYRYVRNPMYLSVSLIVLGEVLLTRSRGLFVWWAAWFALVNLIVLVYEEPALRRQFGPAYDRYATAVGRWLPRLRPWLGA